VLAEMPVLPKMEEVVEYVDKEKDFSINETFWIGLKKEECWMWNSGVPQCFDGWHEKYPKDDEGGFIIRLLRSPFYPESVLQCLNVLKRAFIFSLLFRVN
jgi:hypothetical protein